MSNNENLKMYNIITGEIKDHNSYTFNHKSEWYIVCEGYYPIYDHGKFIIHRFRNEICLPGKTMP